MKQEQLINYTFAELNSILNKYEQENQALKKELDWYKNYCDELIQLKNLPCLPADLRNLRKTNASLAAENEELKKYLNPEKHVGGKDINFDGNKLVKSVEDFAKSLKKKKKGKK